MGTKVTSHEMGQLGQNWDSGDSFSRRFVFLMPLFCFVFRSRMIGFVPDCLSNLFVLFVRLHIVPKRFPGGRSYVVRLVEMMFWGLFFMCVCGEDVM